MEINEEARLFSIQKLSQIGFNDEIFLPLINNRSIKKGNEIRERIIQLYALIGLSLPEIDSDKIKQWLSSYDLFLGLSKHEKDIFEKYKDGKLTELEITSLSWLRESLLTLMWCCELISDLCYPSIETEIEEYLYLIPPKENVKKFLKQISVRNEFEILKQADFHYCLHWLMRNNYFETLETNLCPRIDVIIERRKALEWILSNNDWDNISLDT